MMVDKKSDETDKTPEEVQLERKVDAMMDPRSDVSKIAEDFNKSFAPEVEPPKATPSPPPAPSPPPSPAVAKTATAPELPSDKGETVKVSVNPPKPVEPGPDPDPEPIQEPVKDETVPVNTESAAPAANEYDDAATEQAVDEIVAKEGDTVLAVEDAQRASLAGDAAAKKPKHRSKNIFKRKKTWLIILLVVLAAIFGVPYTRYKVLGLGIKNSAVITIIDSQTNSPVSDAVVKLAGAEAKTDAKGVVLLRAGVGERTLTVSKRYYRTVTQKYFVGFNDNHTDVRLVATGRLVPVTVVNSITGQPVANVKIQVAGTTAKTDTKGKATIALPSSSTADAKLSLTGYNTADVTGK